MSRSPRLVRSLVVASAAAVVLPVLASAAVADTPAGAQVTGTVVRAYVEHAVPRGGRAPKPATPLTWVRTASGTSVRVPSTALVKVPVGATVTVTVGGQVRDGATTGEGIDPARSVLRSSVVSSPKARAAITVPQTDHVTVVRVQPADDPELPEAPADTTTSQEVADMVNGPVEDYWHQQSGGLITLDAAPSTDAGWITTTADCSAPDALWAEAAQKAGFPLTADGNALPNQHLLLLLPEDDVDCADGLGQVGGSVRAGGFLYARTSPDFDGYPAYQHDTLASVITHELGHNFGLLHSGAQECRGTVEGGTCDGQEYGDLYDVMGASWDQVGSLNAAQSARLGFLAPSQVQSLTPSTAAGSYVLSPLSGTTGTRALELTSNNGVGYYVEYRARTGRDAYLDTEDAVVGLDLPSGVVLHRQETTSDTNSSTLLDGTPTGTADYPFDQDDVLVPGRPVTLASGEFTLSLQAAPGGTATLTVDTPADAIARAYDASGGAQGFGTAIGSLRCGLASGGCLQAFQGGGVYWSPPTGAHAVSGAIRLAWGGTGWENGWLGYPATDMGCDRTGCHQGFQGGSLNWLAATGRVSWR